MEKNEKQKHSCVKPRDGNGTSGHDVQRFFRGEEDTKESREKLKSGREKAGQGTKNIQKKRMQRGDFHKENISGKGEAKERGGNAPVREDSVFMESVAEEKSRESAGMEHCQHREINRRYDKKKLYRRWKSRRKQEKCNGVETDFKRDFQTEDNTFTEGMEPEFEGRKKSDRLQKKSEQKGKRTERAREKLPKAKEYTLERVFDEKTGKAHYVLVSVEKEKVFKRECPVRRFVKRAGYETSYFVHGKIAESEKENSAVEGAHKAEEKAEDVYRFVKRRRRSRTGKQREKVAKLEKQQGKAEVRFRYQKFLDENPKMQGKPYKKLLQKRLQKQRIKRAYAREQRKAAKGVKGAAGKGANTTTAIAKKVQETATRHMLGVAAIASAVALLVMALVSLPSCGAVFSEGMSLVLAGSYMSEPKEIDAADLAFSKLELELQQRINSIETDYPGYEEYRYNLDAIGHDPFALISYLSAVHREFRAVDVQEEIESLFHEMYQLSITPVTETRTRKVTKTGVRMVTDPKTGEEKEEEYQYEEEEEYTVSVLEVRLSVTSLDAVAAGRMDDGQKEMYALYSETHGLLQQFYTPLELDWYRYVSGYYGYRLDKNTGQAEFHRGLDIAVPTGTVVYAAMDGTVTDAAYDNAYGNYVVMEDSNGYCIKYAHLETLGVSKGQAVEHGASIGTTGNTGSSSGSHLHLECLYHGEYYNPLFYFETGEGMLNGGTPGVGSGESGALPPDSYDDTTVQTLMEEAVKYLGYPYVWGGSSPSTSFDCSGFVCWVFTNSGVHNLPRTTAQGIYDQCTPVPATEAKAGDIIFFTGTYNSAGAVSHVGIYCGNGVMIHCGDPIKYSSIHTPYWQSHFYAFGRLSGQ